MTDKLVVVVICLFLFKNYYLQVMAPPHRGELSIKVFDVGQGDAILVKTPNGRKILVDGGSNFEVDRYLDREFWLNTCRLDLVVLTHPHQDHLEGLRRVLGRCRVGRVVMHEVKYQSRGYQAWLESLPQQKIVPAVSGDTYILDEVSLIIVWPPAGWEVSENINNSSVTILLDYGGFEALFMGDLEREASSGLDREFLASFIQADLDVYKVPHHGSLDSFNLELLSFLKPKLCLVSVGENKFGHPDAEVLAGMAKEGCRIKRTDLDGTIEVLHRSR